MACPCAGANWAVTSGTCATRASSIVTTQVLAAPVQAPVQPTKVWPVPGVAVNVTTVFNGNSALQVAVQFSPAGWDTTVPVPVTSKDSVFLDAGGASDPPPPPQAASTASNAVAAKGLKKCDQRGYEVCMVKNPVKMKAGQMPCTTLVTKLSATIKR